MLLEQNGVVDAFGAVNSGGIRLDNAAMRPSSGGCMKLAVKVPAVKVEVHFNQSIIIDGQPFLKQNGKPDSRNTMEIIILKKYGTSGWLLNLLQGE